MDSSLISIHFHSNIGKTIINGFQLTLFKFSAALSLKRQCKKRESSSQSDTHFKRTKYFQLSKKLKLMKITR